MVKKLGKVAIQPASLPRFHLANLPKFQHCKALVAKQTWQGYRTAALANLPGFQHCKNLVAKQQTWQGCRLQPFLHDFPTHCPSNLPNWKQRSPSCRSATCQTFQFTQASLPNAGLPRLQNCRPCQVAKLPKFQRCKILGSRCLVFNSQLLFFSFVCSLFFNPAPVLLCPWFPCFRIDGGLPASCRFLVVGLLVCCQCLCLYKHFSCRSSLVDASMSFGGVGRGRGGAGQGRPGRGRGWVITCGARVARMRAVFVYSTGPTFP